MRIHCDPVVYLHRARALCRWIRRTGAFVDLDLVLDVRASTETRPTRVLHVTDFCARDPRYSVLRHNPWIGTGQTPP